MLRKTIGRSHIESNPWRTRKLLVGLLIFFFVFSLINPLINGLAQSEADLWSGPVNLSRSGAASRLVMALDSSGVIHLIWRDEFAGTLYSRGDGNEWSQPIPVTLPSGGETPTLIPDLNGKIHAFWLMDDNTLYYSQVRADRFEFAQAWSTRQRLAVSALDYSVVLDSAGRLHLVYVYPLESEQFPAGVYYSRLEAGDLRWSDPIALYNSTYFRTLTRETAHVKIDAADIGGTPNLFVVWDNRPREASNMIRSQDGGISWGEVVEIGVSQRPSHAEIYADDARQMLIWQTGSLATSCVQYYQTSSDGGSSWKAPLPVFAQALGCPDRTDFLVGKDNQIFIINLIQGQFYLQAWDGSRWSEPQLQSIMTSFVDPETQRIVTFGCQQPALLGGTDLFVLGCDQGAGKDIWMLRRSLIDVGEWFGNSASWNPVVPAATGEGSFKTVELLAEKEGLFHLFWSQAHPVDPNGPGVELYYARFEAGRWTKPVEIFASSSDKAEQPKAALGSNGRLFLVWSGGQSGEIFFSSVNAADALMPAEWTSPVRLPGAEQGGSSPDIIVAPDGRIFVIYAVPVNEGRGIYLTQSTDGGATWADPVRVFDAQALDWGKVDEPRLTVSENGSLHTLWTQYTLPGGVGPLAMYYSRSDDGGASWSIPVMVTDKPVYWSQIVSLSGGRLHRVWQELNDVRTTLWHETSTDNGQNWQRTSPVSIFGDTLGTPALAWDRGGRLHLMQVVRSSPTTYQAQHWVWSDERWGAETSLNINLRGLSNIGPLKVNMSPDGDLAVIFTGLSYQSDSGQLSNSLYFADRVMEVPAPAAPIQQPAQIQAPPATPTPQASEPTSPPVTIESQATATLPVQLVDLPRGQTGGSSAWLGSIIGPAAAGLIIFVLVFLGIILRRIRTL